MGFTRRDLLKFTGGSVAGLALTPVPWSLLRDSSLVSETWPGVPRPKRGEIRIRYTTCTLCPAGCGVRARCVGDQPVSLTGVAGHPAGGALCTAGLVGHHLAFCSDRVNGPLAHNRPASIESIRTSVAAAIAGCAPHESVAILDPRPGRTASLVYRRFLASLPNGLHCVPAGTQGLGAYGIDLENTRAIVSFGEPVLDGWLSPGRVLAARSHIQLIQIEPAYSRTASLADLWVPLPPGTEEVFAAAVQRAVEGDSNDPKATEVARILLRNQPAIAIGPGAAVAKLNGALGSIGKPGGFLPRRDFTPAVDIASVPDHSIRVVIVEESAGADGTDWDLLRRKLVSQDATVVALTPWLDGCARHADYVVPAPLYLEALDEAPTPEGSTVASFSLSPALLQAKTQALSPADFILRLAAGSGSYVDALKQRVAAIQKERRGTLFTYENGANTPISKIASADDLWKTMQAGAVWCDDPATTGVRSASLPFTAREAQNPVPTPEFPLILIAADRPSRHASPLMSKLYRESGLRRSADAAAVHPATGRDHGLVAGCRAIVRNPAATLTVQIVFDPAVMPGVIEMAGQDISPASIRKA